MLKGVVEPETAGDPMTEQKWVRHPPKADARSAGILPNWAMR